MHFCLLKVDFSLFSACCLRLFGFYPTLSVRNLDKVNIHIFGTDFSSFSIVLQTRSQSGFLILNIAICVRWLIIVLFCILLVTDVEHLLMCLLAIYKYYFVKCLLKYFAKYIVNFNVYIFCLISGHLVKSKVVSYLKFLKLKLIFIYVI